MTKRKIKWRRGEMALHRNLIKNIVFLSKKEHKVLARLDRKIMAGIHKHRPAAIKRDLRRYAKRWKHLEHND